MAKHRRCTDGASSCDVEKQQLEPYRMKYIKGLWHSWLWALEMKRRVNHDLAIFGRINPESIKDIDKFLKQQKVTV